jgi:hypothetical protein
MSIPPYLTIDDFSLVVRERVLTDLNKCEIASRISNARSRTRELDEIAGRKHVGATLRLEFIGRHGFNTFSQKRRLSG